jgi:hypothetical protein
MVQATAVYLSLKPNWLEIEVEAIRLRANKATKRGVAKKVKPS